MKSITATTTALVLLTIGLVALAFTALPRPPQTVVFDLKGTLERYQEELLAAELNDQEHRARLAAFDTQLRQMVDEYARTHHLTIVVPAAVISGAPDMTVPIQRHVIETMRRQQQNKD